MPNESKPYMSRAEMEHDTLTSLGMTTQIIRLKATIEMLLKLPAGGHGKNDFNCPSAWDDCYSCAAEEKRSKVLEAFKNG